MTCTGAAVLEEPMHDPNVADAEYVRLWRSGDEQALAALHERHERGLRLHVERSLPAALRRRVAAEDVVQETWIAASGAVARFEDRGEGAFAAWLRGIADNKLRETMRRHLGAERRDGGRELSRGARPETAEFRAGGPSPSQAAMGNELAAQVDRALARLRPDDRRILRLVQTDGLTLEAAAERLGRTYEATRKLYARALARFSALVDEEGGAR